MSIKFKALSLGFAYLTALTLGFASESKASCYQEIEDSGTHLVDTFTDDRQAGIFVPLGVAVSSSIAPAVGAGVAGAYGVSTTSDYATRLSDDQLYAQQVLSGYQSSTKASFLKLVKKEISKNKDAVIPSEEEILSSIDYVNQNLIACRNDKNNFFRPTKASLLKVVVEDLSSK